MTEEDAKTKWCPMFRVAVAKEMSEIEVIITNREFFAQSEDDDHVRNQGYCIASDCMMWRLARKEGHGYCGLAGAIA